MNKVNTELGLEIGSMHFFITNLHIYPRHYNMFKK